MQLVVDLPPGSKTGKLLRRQKAYEGRIKLPEPIIVETMLFAQGEAFKFQYTTDAIYLVLTPGIVAHCPMEK